MNLYLSFTSKLPILVLLLLSAASVVAGDYFAKRWSLDRGSMLYLLAVLGYFGSSFFYLPTLLRGGLVVTSIIWSVLSIAGFLLIGFFVFHEKVNALQIAGIVLGIVSVVLLSLPMKSQ